MDKKRLVILISSVVALLLVAGLFLFLFFNKDTANPVEKPNEEDIVQEEDLEKIKEIDFEDSMATNQINADSEIIEDEERKKIIEEQKG